MPEFVFLKSGAPHQSEAPFSEFAVCQSSYFSNQGRPISPRLHFRSSRFARVRIFQIRGAPSVRGSIFGVHGLPEFVFFKSGAPHQSEAPFSEFAVCQSSYFSNQGAPSVRGSIFGVRGLPEFVFNFSNQGRPISARLHFRSSRFARVRIFQIRGAPSVRGSIFGVRGLPEFVFFKSGAPHQSEAPFSEFAVCQSSYFSNQGRPISARLHFRSSRFARVRIFQIRGAPSVRGSIFGVHGLPEFVFFKSGAPHQCEAPFSEFAVCQSSYFSNQGRPISPRLHFRSSRFARVRIFEIRGAPSVRGSVFGVHGLPEFVFFKSGAPHHHFRSSRFARVRIFQIRGAPSFRGSIFGVRGLPEFVFLKSGAPHQSEAPFSEFTVCQSSYFSNQGRPISARLHFRSSRFARVRIFQIRGAPSVRGSIFGVHGLPEFVFFKSGAPHQCEAPFSEFAVCQSSYF